MHKLPQTSKGRLRVARARELLVSGWSRSEIRDALMEEYGICRKSAYNSLRHLDNVLVTESSNRRKVNLHRQLAKLEHAQYLAVDGDEKPDLSALVQIIREQNKLLQLHLPDMEDGESWEALPMILRPLPTQEPDSTQTPSNGHSNGSTNGTSPYSARNGSS